MPTTVLTPIRTVNTASAPSSPTEGLVYYNSTTHTLNVWNGTAWVPLLPVSFARTFMAMGG